MRRASRLRFAVPLLGAVLAGFSAGSSDETLLDDALKTGDMDQVLRLLGPAEAVFDPDESGKGLPAGSPPIERPPSNENATLEIEVPEVASEAESPRRRPAFLPLLFQKGPRTPEPAPAESALTPGASSEPDGTLEEATVSSPATPASPPVEADAPEVSRESGNVAAPAPAATHPLPDRVTLIVPDPAPPAGDAPSDISSSGAPRRAPEDSSKARAALESLVANMPAVDYSKVESVDDAPPVVAVIDELSSPIDDDLAQARPLGPRTPVVRSVLPSPSAPPIPGRATRRDAPAALPPPTAPPSPAPTPPTDASAQPQPRTRVDAALLHTHQISGSDVRAGPGAAGWKYEGQWNNGTMDGIGTITYPDGWRYEGEWRNGQISGIGTLFHPDGWTYHGEWQNGKMDGSGTLTYADGWKYIGQWRDGRMHGEGELIHPKSGAP